MKKLLVAATAMAAMTVAASAQDASTTVEAEKLNTVLMPILMAIGSAAATVVTALAGLAVMWIKKQLNLSDAQAAAVGLQIDQAHRDSLQTALTNAAGLALNSLGNDLKGRVIDVKNPAVANAINSVLDAAPDAVKYFGLDKAPNAIAEKIVAKLPQVANTTTST
jgi:hypothetical protein